jgi:predicted alpha/beta hydrolase family esterase
MKNAIILHGTLGSPEGNWFAWLKSELESKELTVWLPQLPHTEQPSLREWTDFVHDNCPFTINNETLIVGHSSGAILALILAQESGQTIGAIMAVSVFHDNSLQWEPNNHLFDVPFDWQKIRNHTHKLLFVHSDDDPYVPLDQARYVAKQCGSEAVIIPKQGHFNLEKSEDYKQFPALIELMTQQTILSDATSHHHPSHTSV